MLLSIKTYKNIEISIFIIQNIETLPKNYSSVKGRVLDISIYISLSSNGKRKLFFNMTS